MNEGIHIYNTADKYNVKATIEMENCMVDLLAREGRVKEAYEFVKQMESPNEITWTSLLAGDITIRKI